MQPRFHSAENMRHNSDPMAAKAESDRQHEGEHASEHGKPATTATKKSHREDKKFNRDSKKDTEEDEPESHHPTPMLDLKGNEVAHVGHSAFDPSLLGEILPKNKNNLEFEHGTALGSIPGSTNSTNSTSTILEPNRRNKDSSGGGHNAGGGLTKKTSKTKNAEVVPERGGSKLRTQPPCVTMNNKSKERMKRSGSDLKQKAKSKDVPTKEAAGNKKTSKSTDSETRLKTHPDRKKSTEKGATLKTKDHSRQQHRSLKKVAGSGKTKQKPKTSENRNK